MFKHINTSNQAINTITLIFERPQHISNLPSNKDWDENNAYYIACFDNEYIVC